MVLTNQIGLVQRCLELGFEDLRGQWAILLDDYLLHF